MSMIQECKIAHWKVGQQATNNIDLIYRWSSRMRCLHVRRQGMPGHCGRPPSSCACHRPRHPFWPRQMRPDNRPGPSRATPPATAPQELLRPRWFTPRTVAALAAGQLVHMDV